MSKKSIPAILAMGLAFQGLAQSASDATASLQQADYKPRDTFYRKTNLTNKQKKNRAKAKAAGKARRKGR